MTSYTSASLVKAEVQAKAVFSSDTVPSLSDVNNWIEQNSRIIDSWTNNYFGSETITDEYLDYDGRCVVSLPFQNVLSITSLSYNKAGRGLTPEWVTLEEGFDKNYLFYDDVGEVEFLIPAGVGASVNPNYSPGSKRFKISYTRGFSEVPKQVERLATLMTAKNVLSASINSRSGKSSIRVGQIMVSSPERFSVQYVNSLNQEIESLKNSIGEGFKTYRFTRVYR